MMKFLNRFAKSRGLAINLIASMCFVFLAVYAWGLTWGEVLDYFLALVMLIGGIIGLAFLCAWILRKFKP